MALMSNETGTLENCKKEILKWISIFCWKKASDYDQ